ncbi:MAG TPA: WhiB family transcriptional regulator [Candidatus Avipropionibacterium avicola]|uniref:WhiB family transcriptional regulator n=1 Tax=Candidatus Avipropionibacterium avicola TaxID=2840701 RepID=A0A9D1KL27_9ACTN|nr:WhiB family transcriptional regulator [Candidatus Avipropionibacterium avicola]
MTARPSTPSAPACLDAKDIFQSPMIEEPPTSSAGAATRREYAGLVRQAEKVCADCPLVQQCLYDAVVKFDVSGFCAGTTRKERNEIRAMLGVQVAPEDFDTLAGVTARHRQVDHDEVVRLRRANPHESLEMLAHRLGCSLSTVKRHLRKARNQTTVTPIRRNTAPSMAQVVEAFRRVKGLVTRTATAA